jgi:hypothetical protein
MIKFIDSTHTYTNLDGLSYRSVTSILKKLEPKKDWDAIAMKYAKKNGISVEEVKLKWKHEKDISIIRGKKAHSLLEAKELSATLKEVDGLSIPVIAPEFDGDVKYNKSMKLTPGVYPEIILWLDSIQVAGQADRLEIVDGKINVYDYKSNKKIDHASFVNHFGESEKLIYPCGHLDNCNFNIYSLQLNMYAYMVKRHNPTLEIGKLEIIHLLFENPDDLEEITGTVIYPVPHMQREIVSILTAIQNKKI